jgi:aspartokinase/homoserine dehydrogenase 1
MAGTFCTSPVLLTEDGGHFSQVDPLWDTTSHRLAGWFASRPHLTETDCAAAAPVVVVTGFVASTAEGTPTTLKRSGSDFSATIFARLMDASKITMWKNVNGVYTADPRRVPEAFPIAALK